MQKMNFAKFSVSSIVLAMGCLIGTTSWAVPFLPKSPEATSRDAIKDGLIQASKLGRTGHSLGQETILYQKTHPGRNGILGIGKRPEKYDTLRVTTNGTTIWVNKKGEETVVVEGGKVKGSKVRNFLHLGGGGRKVLRQLPKEKLSEISGSLGVAVSDMVASKHVKPEGEGFVLPDIRSSLGKGYDSLIHKKGALKEWLGRQGETGARLKHSTLKTLTRAWKRLPRGNQDPKEKAARHRDQVKLGDIKDTVTGE
jgi:hypothetical protein